MNYQKQLEEVIKQEKNNRKKLLLHSCCAPCSSYVLETLSEHFRITVFYYNPNIYPEEEYWKRVEEQKEFIRRLPVKYPISFLEGNFDKDKFYQTVKGLEHIPEGGERCFSCYRLRLEETIRLADQENFDYVTTTLTISPLKNAEKLKIASVETAKEAERGLVDIETLTATNQVLISTFDEVMKIQQEGRMKRQEAEAEMLRIEGALKQKLLEIQK